MSRAPHGKQNPSVCLVSASYPPAHCGIGDYTQRLRHSLAPLLGSPWLITTHGATADDRMTTVPAWDLGGVGQTLRTLADLSPDVVHMQYPGKPYGHRPDPCLLPLLHRMQQRGRPWLTTLHECRIAHPLRKAAVLALALPSDGLIFTCKSERDFVTRRLPLLRQRSCVIPVGGAIPVDSTLPREECRRRLGFDDSHLVACHFGIVQPNKGVEALLDGMALAMDRLPHLRLIVVADLVPETSPCHARLAERCTRAPLAGRVHWTGYLTPQEVSRTMRASDLCVLPYTDGVSARRTTFVTAAQHGLPIITTCGPETATDLTLRHGRDALLAGLPLDAEAFGELILQAAESAELRASLGKHVGGVVQDRSWEAIAEMTVDCYHRALAGIPLGEVGGE